MKSFLILVSYLYIFSGSALAQMWGNSTLDVEAQEEAIVEEAAPQAPEKNQKPQKNIPVSDDDLNITEEEKEALQKKFDEANFRFENGALKFNPVFDMPATDDGSPRGTTGFISTSSEEDNSNIFMYINAIRMNRSATLGTTCRVRFITANGLNKKISNVSVKLVWPQNAMANLSFNDVNPNSEVYLDYMLMGAGCYQLDKLPNIIVNRCRVKGMSQEACAGKIRWLSKNR